MIDQLPEGKNIGWMQAPPRWVFTHTARFVGIVRVIIQDGEGFILIRKGKPLVYYFKNGHIILCGEEALDYINSRPTIEFSLCRYSADELSRALKICNIDETPAEQETVQEPGCVVPAAETKEPSPSRNAVTSLPEVPVEEMQEPAGFAEANSTLYEDSGSGPVFSEEPAIAEEPDDTLYEDRDSGPVFSEEPGPAAGHEIKIPENLAISPQADPDDPDFRILGQIRKLNGIVAVSVFSADRTILIMGDAEIEPLLRIARSMVATAEKITPCLDWGSFVHMTLQIPDGNMIIAPYHENHLCIISSRTINIGHIRRILRDLQQG